MRIIFHECKKALNSPILIALLLLFTAFNILLIYSNSYFKEELKVANELANTYGVQITDKSLHQLEQDLQKDLSKLNEFNNQLQLKEMYLNLAIGIDSEYEQIDWKKIAEFEVGKYGLSGSAAQTLKNEYANLSQRFDAIKANGEHKTWFFVGKAYGMHSFLFRTVFGL